MTAHTPGPWDASEWAVFVGVTTTVAICSDLPERRANARLIAAAPELLEAANDYLDAASNSWATDKEIARRLSVLRAVISRAEGKE